MFSGQGNLEKGSTKTHTHTHIALLYLDSLVVRLQLTLHEESVGAENMDVLKLPHGVVILDGFSDALEVPLVDHHKVHNQRRQFCLLCATRETGIAAPVKKMKMTDRSI